MNRLPSLNALMAFAQVARAGSIRAAAEQLHVTPSAVSHQIKRLEQELGVVLLERSSKQVSLTKEGLAYSDDLKDIFERLAQATARIRQRQGSNVVTITTLPVFAIKWLVRRLADFHERHPDIEVRVGTTYKTQDLAASGYDLGIRWGGGKWAGLTADRLMGDCAQPVCSPRYLQEHGFLHDISAVASSRLIHMGPTRGEWKTWLAMHGHDPKIITGGLQFNEPTSAIQAAVDGLGIVLAPRALVEVDLDAGTLVPAHQQRIQMHDAYYLVHASRTGLSRAGRVFRDWLMHCCREFEARSPAPDLCLMQGAFQRRVVEDDA